MVFRLSCGLLLAVIASWWFFNAPDSAQTDDQRGIVVAVPDANEDLGFSASSDPERGEEEVDVAASATNVNPIFVEDNPNRMFQSVGEDIDFDDFSVFEDTETQSIGPDVDIEDLTVFSDAIAIDVGEDLDIEDFDVIEVRSPQSIGEDLNIEDFYGIGAEVSVESVGEDVDPD